MSELSAPPRSKWTMATLLICFIAAIGFAFDIYELLMLPLIIRPALLDLGGHAPGTADFKSWSQILFYVPAVAGGIFGLLGGYLTDRLGRRRVLTWSILLYAFGAFAAGFSTSLPMLLFFRCCVFIGVCVEFVAAVAWLAELFSNPEQREEVLGFTQAFSSVGGLLVAVANGMVVAWVKGDPYDLGLGLKIPHMELPSIALPGFLSFLGDVQNPTAPWRYTLMSGLIPAIPLLVIRPFLPESPAWAKKREAGTLRRPSIRELFEPRLRRTTIVTTAMFACSFAAAFGAIQQMPQIVPGLPDVKQQVADAVAKGFDAEAEAKLKAKLAGEEKTEEEIKKAVADAKRKIAGPIEQGAASAATKVQEVGGLFGRFALAGLIMFVASRRNLLRMFLFPGLLAMPIVFGYTAVTDLSSLKIGMFFAGFLTVAQFSFWGNYLPHVYPMHLRGTGESFAANIGGRLIGTMFYGITQEIAFYLPGEASQPTKVAYTAAGVAFAVYLANVVLCHFLPEPQGENFQEH